MTASRTITAVSAAAHLALVQAHESAADVLRRRNPAAAARHDLAGRELRSALATAPA
jgi:hypothetical protein